MRRRYQCQTDCTVKHLRVPANRRTGEPTCALILNGTTRNYTSKKEDDIVRFRRNKCKISINTKDLIIPCVHTENWLERKNQVSESF